MEFPPEFTIKDKKYRYVDTQRTKSTAIYTAGSEYLRIGEEQKITRDLEFHKKMEDFGFPVPKLLDKGMFENMMFFVESSLGERHFGYLFKDEVEETGRISDVSFEAFSDVCVTFAEAQLRTVTNDKNWDAFAKGIHLDFLCEELPEHAERILNKYEQVVHNLSPYPFVLCHGDLTPFNIYPKGIIDFEDSFIGPAGYDLGGLIEHLNWFPESAESEYYRLYNFSSTQKKELLEKVDSLYEKRNLPKLSDHIKDFDFARGVWFAVRLQNYPKLQNFRYSLIKEALD